ncbi:transcriptional repressor p66-alpha-like [Mercenaria mercenaria]|uniref:transcriptional repressor p66-alpha-like n=1 Tax=Mercenaria mercenaria TaxID=6596 RepID=UPI00234E395C|nr:transcriptional repressor p66-alpha-like [Mercenaria mercenaria]
MDGNTVENEPETAAPSDPSSQDCADKDAVEKEDSPTNGKRQLEDEEVDKAESPPVKRSKTTDDEKESETADKEESEKMDVSQTEEAPEEKSEDNKVEIVEKHDDGKIIENTAEKETTDDKEKTKTEDNESVLVNKVEDISKDSKVVMNGVNGDDNVEEDMGLDNKSENEEKTKEGSVHSEDSEKENVDVPMDLSRKSATPVKDVIMLSDEEEANEARMNGEQDYSLDDLKLKRKMIKRLQAELRNEEAKLVLLKKLRFSQMSQQVADNVARKTPQPNQHSSQPPPLVRGNQQNGQQAKPAHSQPPQLQRPNGNILNNKSQGPPPLVMAPRVDQQQLIRNQMKLLQQQQQQQQQLNSGKQQQNNLSGFRGTQAQADALRQMQQVQQRTVEETPAQRQAAAKLALRKQLEKTLLQIPPPKPPPPEMNFIPSLASPDFIYLLGLEEAVNFIIDTNLISKGRKNPDEKMVCNPFTCVQCGTDFTPVWKREKPGSKNVICEQCVTSNQKKALKQEHTNRLKSAFVKALQQEQEIERMQSQEMKSAPVSVPKEKSDSRSERDSRESSARNAAAQAYKESMETLRQHQNLVQAHQAAALRMGQPLGLQGFNPRAPFPYQLPFAARASDLQRQYLLDMIPKGGLPWNS